MRWVLALIMAVAGPSALASDSFDGVELSTRQDCEVIVALLAAEIPAGPPNRPQDIFVLDPATLPHRQFLSERGHHPIPTTAQMVQELFPDEQLDSQTAADLTLFYRWRGRYEARCDLNALRVSRPSHDQLSPHGGLKRGVQPQIAVSRPVISRDGRYALAGHQWSYLEGHAATDDCLFERQGGDWRLVNCSIQPMLPVEVEAGRAGPGFR